MKIYLVLVGDVEFKLSNNLLIPSRGHQLNIPKHDFNYRLTRA